MAYFHKMDLTEGWWFYFELRVASGDEEFQKDFMSEIERVFLMNGSKDIIVKNDKKQKRVPVPHL